jgi:hypothetical protein
MYLTTVRRHASGDVAAILVSRELQESGTGLSFVFTTYLGTRDRIRNGGAALIGDDIFLIGYPAGIYDLRNADPIWRTGIISTNPLLGYAFQAHLQQAFGLPAYLADFS